MAIDSNTPKSGLELASGVQKRVERLQLGSQPAIATANAPVHSQKGGERQTKSRMSFLIENLTSGSEWQPAEFGFIQSIVTMSLCKMGIFHVSVAI